MLSGPMFDCAVVIVIFWFSPLSKKPFLASRVVDMSKRMSEDETAGASLVDMLGDDDDDFHG